MKDLSLSQTKCRLNCSVTNFHNRKNKMDFVLAENNLKSVLTKPIPDKKHDTVVHQKFPDDDFRTRHIIHGCANDDTYTAFHRHQSSTSLCKRYAANRMSEDANVGKHSLKNRAMFQKLELEEDHEILMDMQVANTSEWSNVYSHFFLNTKSMSLGYAERTIKIRSGILRLVLKKKKRVTDRFPFLGRVAGFLKGEDSKENVTILESLGIAG